jgi:hypothetical protein
MAPHLRDHLPVGDPFWGENFATGQCNGLQVEHNTFEGVGVWPGGFLMTPSVAFAPSRTPPGGPSFGPVEEAAAADAQPASNVVTGASQLPQENPLTSAQNILTQGTANAALAANGGTVVLSSLDHATFKDNTFERLGVAVLIFAESGMVQVSSNAVTACQAGFWLLSPSQASQLLTEPLDDDFLLGIAVALGYPLPQGDTTLPVTVSPPPPSVRIYTGLSSYTDSQKDAWTPDGGSQAVTISGGSSTDQPPHPSPIQNALPASSDQSLYQAERWGNNFTYTFSNLPIGYYQITLKFAEIFYTTKGQRVFNVLINGIPVLTHFDIVADVGGPNIADDKVFNNIPTVNGQISIQFVGANISTDNNAKIAAVEVDPQWQAASPSLNLNAWQNFFAQLVALGVQGFATLPIAPIQLRVMDNDMRGASSVTVLILGDDQVQNGKLSSLMMTGNRLSNQLLFSTDHDPSRRYFVATATLLAITRCVVSGNMIVNEAPTPLDRTSFLLDDSVLPAAEVVVMSNVFQGDVAIVPEHYPSNSQVPFPMNSWRFLNTVVQ